MTATVTSELYAQVQHFYARQMQALDDGRLEEYAGTFTKDGSFQHSPGVPAAVGRDAILAELRSFLKKYEDDPTQRRHYFNQIVLEPGEDGGIRSTVYALIVRVRPGEKPDIWPSTVVHDVIDVTDGEILLRSRTVSYDQLV
ncbi:actinorhodin biosynthesis protein ActVIA [Streptomyces africanus]|uniref:Actinorhodin biosynthesis protein ActVIA n=1 Tax=Streptomyces africanus TaxID=231024 RepID=A0ABU0QLI8_9ACTN|nr:nuclear transport factor 2 family protein [Streptomyces africanus]MDQ0748248.1 actinorhodin biosynthesis protein ActVIA [Streptomyces africanus]